MFSGNKFINIISIVLIVIVNLIFLLKYTVNYNLYPGLIIPAYLILSGLICYSGNSSNLIIFNKKFTAISAVLFSAAVLAYILFFERIGEIGRQPAIDDWIYRFKNGMFPYNSSLIPSSYPVIFFLAYPFYIIGNTGILEFVGIILFLFFLFMEKDSPGSGFVRLLFLITSAVIYYEIVTRSELFFNMMLIAGAIYFSERFLDVSRINSSFLVSSLITGMVLCTRSVAALIFTIYYLYKFRLYFKNLVVFTITALIVFAAFLIPFYLWNPHYFLNYGPFAIQTYSSNLPLILIVILFLSAFYAGWIAADLQEIFFASGFILFFSAAVSFLIRVTDSGFSDALFNDGYDIAYFILCFPMLLLSLKDYEVDRYVGKKSKV